MPDRADPSSVSRSALVVLAVIAVGAALYWLSDILTPPAMALFLAIVIDGVARVLKSRLPWLPARAALPVAIIVSVLLFGAAIFIVADNGTSFVQQLIAYAPRLNALITDIGHLVGVEVVPTLDELIARLNPTRYLGDVARAFQNFASDALFILVYLGFIIASRGMFERKMAAIAQKRGGRREAFAAFHRIRDGVEQYLWVQTVTGLMIAFASWAVMAVIGLENAVFWAFLIFIASYIPIIGGAVGILAPPLFALIQFQPYWPAIVLLVVLQAIQFVVGNVILPRMQGDSLNIDPVAVLLALAFWGKIWGAAGMFLSTPLTVMAMVILAQFESSRWLAVLLSADGEPQKLKERPGHTPDENPEKPGRKSPPKRRGAVTEA
jgi:predicted PurR-regulated permease PerM